LLHCGYNRVHDSLLADSQQLCLTQRLDGCGSCRVVNSGCIGYAEALLHDSALSSQPWDTGQARRAGRQRRVSISESRKHEQSESEQGHPRGQCAASLGPGRVVNLVPPAVQQSVLDARSMQKQRAPKFLPKLSSCSPYHEPPPASAPRLVQPCPLCRYAWGGAAGQTDLRTKLRRVLRLASDGTRAARPVSLI
jgi:hypothetical protein